jgi:hypothetical protein
MARRHLWKDLNELSEQRLRVEVILPLLQHTPGLESISDVHGKNEAGLDVIFFTRDAVRQTCFGVQLKRGNIGGGGTGSQTVEDVIGQLKLARKFKHPVAVGNAGSHRIERFIVATSGNITEGARREIAETLEGLDIDFWDGHEIVRRINKYYPDLLSGIDGRTVAYLNELIETYDRLDALDQLQLIQRRTLSDIFEDPQLRRKYAPSVVSATAARSAAGEPHPKGVKANALTPSPKSGRLSRLLPTGVLYTNKDSSVVIADQNDGKTSLLRMLAIKRARQLLSGSVQDDEDQLPVLVRARNILDAASMEAALVVELRRLSGAALEDELPELLSDGAVIVSVDSFSELPSEEEKDQCAALIDTFLKKHRRVRTIIAGRPADFLEPKFFVSLTHYQIVAFSDKQVASLTQKWTHGLMRQSDVTKTMVGRIKDALQLPGSPIPAIIGVMVFEEEKRYITNTADAVDTYMTIRLGRYSREMGIKQEVEWSRKQDLLAEVAFSMVEQGVESLSTNEVVAEFDRIFARLGEVPRGATAVGELVDSGVLAEIDGQLYFHRTAFRDFFAAQHLFRRRSAEFDAFFERNLWDKRWGSVLMFAAGLRRHNTELLLRLNELVKEEKDRDISGARSEYTYAAYLLGRLLTNSEASDASSRLDVLRTCLDACHQSIPDFVEAVRPDLGNVAELAALIGVEQTFLVTVGVPWLALQFQELALDESLSEEERFLVASVNADIGSDGCIDVLERLSRKFRQPRVLLVLFGLVKRLLKERHTSSADRKRLKTIEKLVLRGLTGHREEVKRLLQFRSKALEIESRRIRRLNGGVKADS